MTVCLICNITYVVHIIFLFSNRFFCLRFSPNAKCKQKRNTNENGQKSYQHSSSMIRNKPNELLARI